MLMDEEVDHGPILAQQELEITNHKAKLQTNHKSKIQKIPN